MRPRRLASLLLVLLAASSAAWAAAPAAPRATPYRATKADLRSFRSHLRTQWHVLERDVVRTLTDPKLGAKGKNLTYVPAGARIPPRRMAAITRAGGRVLPLPKNPLALVEHGSLYLPGRFVTPGGRFQEQFGWDSYFIAHGMLDEGHVKVPREMTENLIYEVRNYGKVLNSNRTYSYGRSQPPFLTRMILDVYGKTGNKAWAAGTLDAVEKYHRYFTSGARRTKETGLSRYHDGDRGRSDEVAYAGTGEYDRMKARFRAMSPAAAAKYYDHKTDRLTPHFYRGDRAMRASGFDTTDRFGPGGGDAHEYNPVELNALLYRMEMDAAKIAEIANRPRDAQKWRRRAQVRQDAVNRTMWNPKKGLYFDHHVTSGKQSDYEFASTFFPLWVGMATQEQADAVAANLGKFERAGGLATSTTKSGGQWDGDVVWAPLTQVAVEGLRRYGHHEAANRISVNFLSMVLKEQMTHGSVFEKYNGKSRSSNVRLKYGYTTNETGFGWTNAGFISLYKQLPRAERAKVLDLGGVPVPGR